MKEFEWNRKEIKKAAWGDVFRRGARAWLTLVAVCVIFTVLGVDENAQLSLIEAADTAVDDGNIIRPNNIEILEEYISNTKIVKDIPFITSKQAIAFIDKISKSNTWIIHLLGANLAYLKRNSGEAVAILILSAVISFILRFFIQNAAIIGKNRYTLECRYSDSVSVGRIFSPFHRKNIINLVFTMFIYKAVVTLWSITVIGGFYKSYQYRFVPYILAENPKVKWRDAKRLSADMTRGFKWKLFVADLSCLHIQLLKLIPLCGICTAVPFDAEFLAEQYIALRRRVPDRKEILIERAFDEEAFVELKNGENREAVAPVYMLESVAIDLPEELKEKRKYTVVEFLYMFFIFSFIGWCYEVGLHIIRDHELVNRGTMYGPWLPIYGSGGVAIIFLLDRFKANKARFFALAMLICGSLEFAASWALDFFFNSNYWDYKDKLMNVNGRVCLVALLMFGIGGMAGVYVIAPKLSEYLGNMDRKRVKAFCVLLCTFFAADMICCAVFGFNAGAGVGGSY